MRKGGKDNDGEICRDNSTKLVKTQELQTDKCRVTMGQSQALHMWETIVKLELFEGFLTVGPGFSLVYKLAFCSTFHMVVCHAQPYHRQH